jgi:NAD(P)-dependent dehydrogenase (short-subunit alcohol dehydrogenase family)
MEPGTPITFKKSILVTGASSGIGRATALRLAKNGWRVFAAVRKDSDAESIVSDADGALETVRLDVADRASIALAADNIKSRLNGRGLDGLFNNAGIGAVAPVEEMSLDVLRDIYEINLFGQIAVIQAYLPLIRLAKGRIINAGSVGDHLTPPFAGALASSKAAFASMSAALRLELRSQGIHVILIEPGSINTPAVEKTLGGVEKTITSLSPHGRQLYGDTLRRMANNFAENEHKGSSPTVVAKIVERALTDRKPRTRYPAGKDAAKLAMLTRILPENLLDLAVLKMFGLPTSFGGSRN